MNMASLKEFLASADKVLALTKQLEDEKLKLADLRANLSPTEKEILGMGATPASNGKPKAAARSKRVSPVEVMAAIRSVFIKPNEPLSKAEIVERAGYDESKINNALNKMKDEIKSVPADKSKPISPRNTAYTLVGKKK
jgi:hypothetical protein